MHPEVLSGRDILTVGESWSVTPDTALDYCARDRRELDTVFQFNHILAFWDPVLGKYRAYWRAFSAGKITEKSWK